MLLLSLTRLRKYNNSSLSFSRRVIRLYNALLYASHIIDTGVLTREDNGTAVIAIAFASPKRKRMLICDTIVLATVTSLGSWYIRLVYTDSRMAASKVKDVI